MNARDLPPDARAAASVRVRGLVQGVGFRPFVVRLAGELQLDGNVRNDGEGVQIDVTGTPQAIAELLLRLRRDAPPLARITQIESHEIEPVSREVGFAIVESAHGRVTTGITPDAAVCSACLADLFDPANRRYRYAFTNCTHCGPRFTITSSLPYDRPNTSMASFAQCGACQREYDSVVDRRFHAQPNACPACGPKLWLTGADGTRIDADDVIAAALARLARGEIIALKGLGGFHLVCDARLADTVARLRARKQRDEKPFAVMAANVSSLSELAEVDAARDLLTSVQAPIVLVPKRALCDTQLAGIAPSLGELGVMLPTTPLHWLLFHEAAGRPAGSAWLQHAQPLLLVMTSANPGGEPLVIDNLEAVARLGGIADAFVMHDREILVRCDDSVLRVRSLASTCAAADEPPADARAARGVTSDAGPVLLPADSLGGAFIRRARGYTPAPIALPAGGTSVLAVGGYLKNTACLTRGAEAFLSQHIGDLDNATSCVALEYAVAHLQAVLEMQPQAVAHDLHPDFFSTQLALRVAGELGVPAIGVQHHHAHIAAVTAEHGITTPVLGLALDGVGHGEDDAFDTGVVWGGELLRVDASLSSGYARLGHLRALPRARTLAHGCQRAASARPQSRDRHALCRACRRTHGGRHAGAPVARAADHQRRSLVRCRRRTAWSARGDGLRGPGCDAAGGRRVRARSGGGRCCAVHDRRRRARPAAAGRAPARTQRRRPGRGAVPRHAGGGAGRLGAAGRRCHRHLDRRLRRRRVHQLDPVRRARAAVAGTGHHRIAGVPGPRQ